MDFYLFAIRTKDFDDAQKVNFLVEAKFRKPLVSNKYLKVAIPLFLLIILGLAFAGAILSK